MLELTGLPGENPCMYFVLVLSSLRCLSLKIRKLSVKYRNIFAYFRDLSVPLKQWDHATVLQWLEEVVQIPITTNGKKGSIDGQQILKATAEDLEKVKENNCCL